MKIVDIRERSVPLHSAMRNAFIDFSKMTASVCAIITDVVRDGKPVIGYGIGSNGRYAQGGILRERLIPRVLEAAPDDLLDSERDNFDPAKVLGWIKRGELRAVNVATHTGGRPRYRIGPADLAIFEAARAAGPAPKVTRCRRKDPGIIQFF